MIFILHYILFNAGLPAILVLLTLYLQTYSNASLSEIGALLMALPFLSILIKPLFCALADRHQAHKSYLIGSLGFMALGYGSLTIAPFFPQFVEQHGRLVWYLDIVGVLVGFSAFGVVWSLGDALAVNAAQVNGVSWGAYRVWAVVSWGVFGIMIGQINEVSFLPKYVPAFFVLVTALCCEMLLLLFWPNKHFIMGGEQKAVEDGEDGAAIATNGTHRDKNEEDKLEAHNRSLSGTLSGTAAARANPRLIGAVANIFMEDLGGTLRSSLKLGGQKQRVGLAEILEQHQQQFNNSSSSSTRAGQPANSSPAGSVSRAQRSGLFGGGQHSPRSSKPSTPTTTIGKQSGLQMQQSSGGGSPRTETFGRATLRRAQLALSGMNSLSAASGTVIAEQLKQTDGGPDCSGAMTATGTAGRQRQPIMYMSSLASNTSLSRAAAARAIAFSGGANSGSGGGFSQNSSPISKQIESPLAALSNSSFVGDEHQQQQQAIDGEQQHNSVQLEQKQPAVGSMAPEDLQLILLKLIVRRDANIWKYLALFTVFGILLTLHLSYFFLHLEQLCREQGYDFSSVTGGMMAAHSVSEVFSFTIVVPYYVPRVGRVGALITCAVVYAIRFAYYGTYYVTASPYTGIAFELCHGISYGIMYSMITDIACECVNHVDNYMPELIERGLVDSQTDPQRLKLPLRATMQGVFSGAFDGLGNGIGALFGGIFLDSYPFVQLWLVCTYICVALIVVYPLSEWRALCGGERGKQQQQVESVKTGGFH